MILNRHECNFLLGKNQNWDTNMKAIHLICHPTTLGWRDLTPWPGDRGCIFRNAGSSGRTIRSNWSADISTCTKRPTRRLGSPPAC